MGRMRWCLVDYLVWWKFGRYDRGSEGRSSGRGGCRAVRRLACPLQGCGSTIVGIPVDTFVVAGGGCRVAVRRSPSCGVWSCRRG